MHAIVTESIMDKIIVSFRVLLVKTEIRQDIQMYLKMTRFAYDGQPQSKMRKKAEHVGGRRI